MCLSVRLVGLFLVDRFQTISKSQNYASYQHYSCGRHGMAWPHRYFVVEPDHAAMDLRGPGYRVLYLGTLSRVPGYRFPCWGVTCLLSINNQSTIKKNQL